MESRGGRWYATVQCESLYKDDIDPGQSEKKEDGPCSSEAVVCCRGSDGNPG